MKHFAAGQWGVVARKYKNRDINREAHIAPRKKGMIGIVHAASRLSAMRPLAIVPAVPRAMFRKLLRNYYALPTSARE